jgi:UDP-N-acetylmuramoyl-tripeptide--D-alanyl-D-alanine ligase
MFTIDEIARATGGRIIGSVIGTVTAVSTDSRHAVPGQLFVPLSGERFDGHTFITAVAEQGITTILAEEQWLKHHSPPETVTCIAVKNCLRSLGDLAAAWRHRFELPVIAVTGSNGKTTVKEMLGTILELTGPGLKTTGNLNNLIGLPQMLFRLKPEHRWAVFEMGMSEPGEIDRLAAIAAPCVGIVLNASPAHLQSMGTIEAVAAAKGELLHRISQGGLAVVNADDSRVASLSQNASARRISFGIERGEVRARDIESLGLDGQRFLLHTPHEEAAVYLKACGRHNMYNALAAASALMGWVELQTIVAGLEAFTPYQGRFRIEKVGDLTLIDDSYNANPASAKAALETLAQLASAGHRIAVLGDMLELGDHEAEAHLGVGVIAGRNVDRLYLLGKRMTTHAGNGARMAGMPEESVVCCADHAEIAGLLHRSAHAGDVILFKGSRGMAMEKVVAELKLLIKGE